jgi:hypothetical protein
VVGVAFIVAGNEAGEAAGPACQAAGRARPDAR